MNRVAGHFGEWLQGRIGAEGPLALVTVACPALGVEARKLGAGPFDLTQPDGLLDLAERMARPLALVALARIASASAARCTAMRGPTGDSTPALAEKLGALGHLRAHTGSARGLIFAPGTVPEHAAGRLKSAGFSHVVEFRTGEAA